MAIIFRDPIDIDNIIPIDTDSIINKAVFVSGLQFEIAKNWKIRSYKAFYRASSFHLQEKFLLLFRILKSLSEFGWVYFTVTSSKLLINKYSCTLKYVKAKTKTKTFNK